MDYRESLDKTRIPQHVAVIMDGNGRWAKNQSEDRIFGHHNGVKAVRDTVEGAAEIGVKFLTLYAFSTENWNRPKEEVDALMELLITTINAETETLNKNRIRLLAIGDIESLPSKCQEELRSAIAKTATNDHMTLVLALSYSSRWEIMHAVKQIADKVKEGSLNPADLNESVFETFLSTGSQQIPDPELLIRTSGEKRISNYLLWQLAYTELYFTEILWPEFRRNHFFEAIYDYQQRERRFGKTSEQIRAEK